MNAQEARDTATKFNFNQSTTAIKEAIIRGQIESAVNNGKFKTEVSIMNEETILNLEKDGFKLNKITHPFYAYEISW